MDGRKHSWQLRQLKKFHRRASRSLRNAVAHLHESRCAEILHSQVPNFVFAAEGAPIDAGLVLLRGKKIPQNPDARLFSVLEQFEGRLALYGIEFKTISPLPVAKTRGPYFFHISTLGPSQRGVGLIIFGNPARPDLVMVAPRFLFVEDGEGCRTFGFPDQLMEDSEPDPFPMVCSPLVMPIELLPEAVIGFGAWCEDPTRGWRNPYHKGTVFHSPSPPTASVIECLLPDDKNANQDFHHQRWLQDGLERFSTSYRLKRYTLSPNIGDFIIIDLETKSRITVEMKRNWADITSGSTIEHKIRFQKTRLVSPFTRWDFLLTIISRPRQKTALLLPVDLLPAEWFVNKLPAALEKASWTAGHDVINTHRFSWDTDAQESTIQGLTRVLDHYKGSQAGLQRSLLRTCDPALFWNHPHLLSSLTRWDDDPRGDSNDDSDDSDGSDVPKAQLKTSKNPQRGAGRRWAPRQYELRWLTRIRQQCAQERFGAFHHFGLSASGSFAFSFGAWDRHQPFQALPKETESIYVNFAWVKSTDQAGFSDHRRPGQFFQATHGETPSIYILVPYDTEMEGQDLNVSVIPSQLLKADAERVAWNEQVLRNGWKNISKGEKEIRLSPGHHVHSYLTNERGIVKVLKRLYERYADWPRSQLDPVLDLIDTAHLDPAQYIITHKTMTEHLAAILQNQVKNRWGSMNEEDEIVGE